MKKLNIFSVLMLMFFGFGQVFAAEIVVGTIKFGSQEVKINAASVSGTDNQGNNWTITTEGTTSFTGNSEYYQIGSGSKPASSITFTTTLSNEITISSFSAKFGGFKGTAGNVVLFVGENQVGSGVLNASDDVVVENTTTATGTVLTVTITDIQKGVKVYNISYSYVQGEGAVNPTVTFADKSIRVGDDALDLSTLFTTNSTGNVTYSIVDGNDFATLAGNMLTPVAEGTVTVKASQAAVDNEWEAAEATATITIKRALSKYAATFTSNAELTTEGGTSAQASFVTIDGQQYDAIKCGSSSINGAMQITIPAYATALHFHAGAWKDAPTTISLSADNEDVIIKTDEFELLADAGISGNSPYVLQNFAGEDDYFSTTLSGLTEETVITIAATGDKGRFVVYGVNYELSTIKSALTIADVANGTVTVAENNKEIASGTEVQAGVMVTIATTPNEGYKLTQIRVYNTNNENEEVEVTDGQFIMPEFAVTVSATFEETKEISELVITGNYKTTYWVGEDFSNEGIVVTAVYVDDAELDVTNRVSYSGYDMTTIGEQTVTITYTEGSYTQTTTYNINIIAIENTMETAYTPAEAIALIDAVVGKDKQVYVKGVVKSAKLNDGTYNIFVTYEDDTDAEFEFYKMNKEEGVAFTEEDAAINEGDTIIAFGILTKYNTIYEFKSGCYMVSYSAAGETTDDRIVTANEENDVKKVIINGQVYIIKNGVRYNALGAEVK